MDILSGLNEKQQEAVLATKGPVLVMAGAGSGKTTALTRRIAYLIQEGVNPWNILAVTFTNKAAGEMKSRIAKMMGRDLDPSSPTPPDFPFIGTFHSLCVRILRKHAHLIGYENSFTIYDAGDQVVLMKKVMREQGFSDKELSPKSVLAHISNAKNQLITPKKFSSQVDSVFAGKVDRLYWPYQKSLKENNSFDFDDLIMRTVQILMQFPEVLELYQEKFQYICVDEYQDTNHSQYTLTNLLSAKHGNLCVIGDSDQSIYSWRGANMQNILDFEKDYPNAQVIILDQNYRSVQNILDCANVIISKNTKRKEKELWSDRANDHKPEIIVASNERHEAEVIVNKIREEIQRHENPDYRDFAVLYRTNAQSRALEEMFIRYAVPYKIVGGIKFYERKEIKDVLAYLRILQNPSDDVSLLRIINVPTRSLGAKTLQIIQTAANQKQRSIFSMMKCIDELDELSDTKKDAVMKFVTIIGKLQEINYEEVASTVIKHTIESTGYRKFVDDGSVEGESRMENVKELISVASKYSKLEPKLSLRIFLEEVALIAGVDTLDDSNNSVTLMTLHGAKGLEFPWVFISGMEEGILPHSRSALSAQELEEERRLFYVGITRARDRLFLLTARTRLIYGNMQNTIPSQFLLDLPSDLVNSRGDFDRAHSVLAGSLGSFGGGRNFGSDFGKKEIPVEEIVGFEVNDHVRHRMWGDGTITEIQGGVAAIKFIDPKIGFKKVALNIAPIEKVEG